MRGCLVNGSTYCGQVVGRRLEASPIAEQILGGLSELRLLKDVRGIAKPDDDTSAQLLDLERIPDRVRHARRSL